VKRAIAIGASAVCAGWLISANAQPPNGVTQHPPANAAAQQQGADDKQDAAPSDVYVIRIPPPEYFLPYQPQQQYPLPYPQDDQAAYSKENNRIQRWLVGIGITQAIIYAVQAGLLLFVLFATLWQVRIANQTFRWGHRPKIRVKHIWLTSDIWHEEPIVATITITNTGTAPARIGLCRFGTVIVKADRELPYPPREDLPPGILSEAILDCGVSAKIPGFIDPRILSHDEHVAIRSGESFLYCYGHIEYRPVGAEGIHATAFCRKLHLRRNAHVDDRGRFRVHADPDYEYQD
jgi:hypothetical protein